MHLSEAEPSIQGDWAARIGQEGDSGIGQVAIVQLGQVGR
jgi:hypothetical protein